MSEPSSPSFPIIVGGRGATMESSIEDPCFDNENENINIFRSYMETISAVEETCESEFELDDLNKVLENIYSTMEFKETGIVKSDEIKEAPICLGNYLDMNKYQNYMHPLSENTNRVKRPKVSPSDVSEIISMTSQNLSTATTVAMANRNACYDHNDFWNKENIDPETETSSTTSEKYALTRSYVSETINQSQLDQKISPLKGKKLFGDDFTYGQNPSLSSELNVTTAARTPPVPHRKFFSGSMRNVIPSSSWNTRNKMEQGVHKILQCNMSYSESESDTSREGKKYRRYDDTRHKKKHTTLSELKTAIVQCTGGVKDQILPQGSKGSQDIAKLLDNEEDEDSINEILGDNSILKEEEDIPVPKLFFCFG